MRILLVEAAGRPPETLREIVKSGSTELQETATLPRHVEDADRVVIWNGDHVMVDSTRLRWPDDEDELRLLFQSAG